MPHLDQNIRTTGQRHDLRVPVQDLQRFLQRLRDV